MSPVVSGKLNLSNILFQTVTNTTGYQRVERVQKVEQVVASKQFVQSGQSFIVETGDPDADAVSRIFYTRKCLVIKKRDFGIYLNIVNSLGDNEGIGRCTKTRSQCESC
jgi:hypothetical protein